MADQPPNEDDDDFELELEPVDPDILARERQRGQQKTDEAVAKVDFDEIDRSQQDYAGRDIDWSKLRNFRFTTRHLFIVTAILALGLTLHVQLGSCMAQFVMAMAAIFAGWFAVYRVERREAADRAKRREEFYAGRRTPATGGGTGELPPIPDPKAREGFKFAFSLKQMLITVTAAAVALTILKLIDVKALTITLGALAVVGLAVQTFGLFEPPPAVVLAWWILLVLYLALGLLAAFFPGLLQASRELDGGTISFAVESIC